MLSLLVPTIVTIGATVALCLGKIDSTAYVALLAGGAVAAPIGTKAGEVKTGGGGE